MVVRLVMRRDRSASDISGDGSCADVFRQPVRQPRGNVHVEPRRTEGVLAARAKTLSQRQLRRHAATRRHPAAVPRQERHRSVLLAHVNWVGS